jgi:hypothetical protein
MANVAILDRRSACRVCGSRSHVTTVANPRSPRLGCCASCGIAASNLLDWYKHHGISDLERLAEVVLELRDGNQATPKPVHRAG